MIEPLFADGIHLNVYTEDINTLRYLMPLIAHKIHSISISAEFFSKFYGSYKKKLQHVQRLRVRGVNWRYFDWNTPENVADWLSKGLADGNPKLVTLDWSYFDDVDYLLSKTKEVKLLFPFACNIRSLRLFI